MAEAKGKRPALEKITSPRGVAKYPRLNVPDTKFNAMGAYSVKLIMPKTVAQPLVDKLNAAADKAYADAKAELENKIKDAKGEAKGKAKKALADLARADLPVKPCYDDDGNETDDVEINFKMNASRKDKTTDKIITMKPKFFDGEGVLIKEENVPQIWGGSILKVSAQVNPFYTEKAGAGVGLRLSGVQIIKLVSGGGGNTAESHGFGKEDDAEFTADSAPAAAKSAPAGDSEAGGGDEEAEF